MLGCAAVAAVLLATCSSALDTACQSCSAVSCSQRNLLWAAVATSTAVSAGGSVQAQHVELVYCTVLSAVLLWLLLAGGECIKPAGSVQMGQLSCY
jgi:hypothetical protein